MNFSTSLRQRDTDSSGVLVTGNPPAMTERNISSSKSPPRGVCEYFEVDLSAKTYNVCKCGATRPEHESFQKDMRRRSRIPFPPKAMLVRGKTRLRGGSFATNPTFQGEPEYEEYREPFLQPLSYSELEILSPDLAESLMDVKSDCTTGVGMYSVKGLRTYMEDSCTFNTGDGGTQSMFAVFDGHGGSGCSKFCAERIFEAIQEVEKKYIMESVLDDTPETTAVEQATAQNATNRRTSSSRLGRKLSSMMRVNSSSSTTSIAAKGGNNSMGFTAALETPKVVASLIEAFQALDSEYCTKSMESGIEDGTTATVLVTRRISNAASEDASSSPRKGSLLSRMKSAKPDLSPIQVEYFVACAGDSRAVLVPASLSEEVIPLSVDHDVNVNESERERVRAKGDKYIIKDDARGVYRVKGRLGGRLGVTRAIGDAFFKPYVTATPEVVTGSVTISPSGNGPLIVLASDGVWGVISNEVVGSVAREFKSEMGYSNPARLLEVASQLTKLALKQGSDDNISVLVIDLSQSC